MQGQLSKLTNLLAAYDNSSYAASSTDPVDAQPEDLAKAMPVSQSQKQVISLRSHVNGSTQLLFSGLGVLQQPEADESTAADEVEREALPNGFELTDFAALGGDKRTPNQEKRTFGNVFRPAGRLKPLDLPRPSKNTVRGNSLEFIPHAEQSEKNPPNKHDYKFTKLPTGLWLSYEYASAQGGHDRKRMQHSSSASDFKAALAANDVQQGNQDNGDALFNAVYSSFAPSVDNTSSLISAKERGRHWWHKYGDQKLSRLFKSPSIAESAVEETSSEFADIVENFTSTEGDEEEIDVQSNDKNVDDVLEEISDLIETLCSYQRNRSLEPAVSGTIPKPTSAEFDVFEMLRDQLSILISSLPPFAVAKLNGDQLEALNISTVLLVEGSDHPGTGQVDDYTWRKQRVGQQATSAPGRPALTPQVRSGYSPAQINPAAYNSQVRNYNAAVPATAAYGMRAPSLQTPTGSTAAYSQTPYQSSGNPYSSRPTVQQFQRPVQNGYGNYGGSLAQAPGSAYVQRASQPGYQQRAQESAIAAVGRSASPQKPTTNGHSYPPRQYSGQQPPTPFPYPRQGSGTPSTPTAAASIPTGLGRHGSTPDRPGTEGGGSAPAASQAPGQMQSQTVEVSR